MNDRDTLASLTGSCHVIHLYIYIYIYTLSMLQRLQTWLNLILLVPWNVFSTAEELGCCSAEPMIGQLGVFLTDKQGLQQAFGSLFIVLHCDLNGERAQNTIRQSIVPSQPRIVQMYVYLNLQGHFSSSNDPRLNWGLQYLLQHSNHH